MRHEEGQLEGVGGLRIFTRTWLPDDDPRVVVVLAHGGGEHSGRYEHVAERFTGEGMAVYTLDHRGHGRSEGKRGMIDRVAHAATDMDQVVVSAREQHPDLPLYLLGHSMGGCLSLAYVLRFQERLDGLVLSAPVAALETASAATRAAGRLLSVVAPSLGVFAVDASKVSRDPEEVRKYETDPLVHHGKLPARTVAELSAAVERFPEQVPAITIPLLVMHGTADTIVPPFASHMVHERASSEDRQLELYEGLFHEILNEPERERVMDDITAWIHARAGTA